MYLCIVSPGDVPIFEQEFRGNPGKKDLNQFIAHAALDMVDISLQKDSSLYLKQIDHFNEILVFAFVTASRKSLSTVS